MAGLGKSAIAQSVAEQLEMDGRLAASFFFSRGKPGRNEIKYLFTTLAYQLTIYIPALKAPILDAIARDASILDKNPLRQFQMLIVDPLSKAKSEHLPMAVVLDAIDECQNEESAADIISLITELQTKSYLPVRFFLTSRPDPHILAKITSHQVSRMTHILALQDVDVEDDIRVFLRHRFDEIHKKGTVMQSVDLPWPSPPNFESLVQKSSGLFVYAATVMNFLDDRNAHPVRRLEMILEVQASTSAPAYAALDQLYIQILTTAPNIKSLRDILGVILTLFDPLAIGDLEVLLMMKSGEVLFALTGLHSIIFIPTDKSQSIAIFHESLRDFLTDARRSGRYFIDLPQYHGYIARHCLEFIAAYFSLISSATSFSWASGYAFGYWASHLRQAPFDAQLFRALEEIANKSLIYWIEALSYDYHLDGALKSLQSANLWISSHNNQWRMFRVSLVLKGSFAGVVLISIRMQGSGSMDHQIRIWRLLELFQEAERFIIASQSRAVYKLGLGDWTDFRQKSRKPWRVALRYVSDSPYSLT